MWRVGVISLICAFTAVADTQDDNPGVLDNPGCIALIEGQIRDNGKDPADYEIKYVTSAEMPDGNGGLQTLSVINKKTGEAMIVIIGAHWQKDTRKMSSL